MISPFEAVKEFHTVFGLPVAEDVKGFSEIPGKQRVLRIHLMEEEAKEYFEAEQKGDIVAIADALADIIVIACGTAVAYGIPLEKVFEEVHKSNMAKQVNGTVLRRGDGKVQKPPGWVPPDVEGILGVK